jgi:hypothetical protein
MTFSAPPINEGADFFIGKIILIIDQEYKRISKAQQWSHHFLQ